MIYLSIIALTTLNHTYSHGPEEEDFWKTLYEKEKMQFPTIFFS